MKEDTPLSLELVWLPPEKLKPYERNTRKHEPAGIEQIKQSIMLDGFNDPIGIWGPENLIVEGHGRQIAALELGMETVPCIRLDHMTDEQRRDYAIRHNRTAELSSWDDINLNFELKDLSDQHIDFSGLDFDVNLDEWFSRETRDGEEEEEGNEEYNAFVGKFKPKKTTDDCFTPDNIYKAVSDWVANEYSLDPDRFVRPFFPGGDYRGYTYPPGCVVVDNPPFSILADIIKFYCSRGIKFFLFAPALTLFTAVGEDVEYMPEGCDILYENGASVKTSFINNLGQYRIYVSPTLHEAVEAANDENLRAAHADLPKYNYPMEAVLAAQIHRLAHYGQTLKIPKDEAAYQNRLDMQAETGKDAFGGLFLISERAAAERAASERAAATTWNLSEREIEKIKAMGPWKKRKAKGGE